MTNKEYGNPVKDPLVSVIITTYYRNEALRSAIDSVLEQTYAPIEIVVVDGSGEGYARPVVEEYGKQQIMYIAQDDDKGAQAARSIGAEAASGDYINFLDDDDRFLKRKIEKQINVVESNSDTGVVYCGKEIEEGHRMMPNPEIRGNVLEYALKFQMTPSSPSTMLIDGTVLTQILPLSNRHGADDLGMKIELAQITNFDFVNESLVVVSDSEDSLGSSKINVEGRWTILNTYSELYDQYPQKVRDTAVAYTYMLEGELLLDETRWSLKALKSIFLGCYRYPGINLSFVGYLLASIFGRPGRDLGRWMYFKFIIGDENTGKIA